MADWLEPGRIGRDGVDLYTKRNDAPIDFASDHKNASTNRQQPTEKVRTEKLRIAISFHGEPEDSHPSAQEQGRNR